MNERLKELMIEAGYAAPELAGRANKLAELIVRECIDKVNKITGLDITFVTTAGTNEEAYELLKELGMPFKNAKKENN